MIFILQKYKIQRIQSKMIKESQNFTLDPDNIADENEREMFIMVNGNDELENGDFVQRRNSNDNKNVKFE